MKLIIASQFGRNSGNTATAGAFDSLLQNPVLLEQMDLEPQDIAIAQAFSTPQGRASAKLDDSVKAALVVKWLQNQKTAAAGEGEETTGTRGSAQLDDSYYLVAYQLSQGQPVSPLLLTQLDLDSATQAWLMTTAASTNARASRNLEDQYKYLIRQQLADPTSGASQVVDKLSTHPLLMDQMDVDYSDLQKAKMWATPRRGSVLENDEMKELLIQEMYKAE